MTPEQEVEFALLKKQVEGLDAKIDGLQSDMRELVEAWRAAGTLVGFVKTIAAVVLSVSVILGALKFGITPGDAK